jgi:hypothetical protein
LRAEAEDAAAADFSLGELCAETSVSGHKAATPIVRKRIINFISNFFQLRFRKARPNLTPMQPDILK